MYVACVCGVLRVQCGEGVAEERDVQMERGGCGRGSEGEEERVERRCIGGGRRWNDGVDDGCIGVM